MLIRDRAARALVLLLLGVSVALSGCPSGESRDIPPGPTAAPNSSIFVYVAQARDPVLGTNGGAVSVYELGADGLLPATPNETVTVVNPRRLVRHPALPVLYVATSSQVLAFDITGGGLEPLLRCGPNGGLASPCATEPVPGSNPIDMMVVPNASGEYLLYVVEQGGGQDLDTPTRLAAYKLDSQDGGLPLSGTQAVTPDATFYQGAAITSQFAYVGDTGLSQIVRFALQADGNLPDPAPTPSPLFPTPVPTLTPTDPTPGPTPSPSPTAFRAFAPGKIIEAQAQPETGTVDVLYVVQQSRRRIGANPIDAFGNLGEDPSSESNTRGIYNVILLDSDAVPLDPSAVPTRIYGAAFQNGQVDSFAIDANGNIIDNTLSATFANTSSYPTGLALLKFTPAGGSPTRTLFVSVGGFDRVDAYAVNEDGTLAERPFSSTQPITGTFPADVLVYVEGQ